MSNGFPFRIVSTEESGLLQLNCPFCSYQCAISDTARFLLHSKFLNLTWEVDESIRGDRAAHDFLKELVSNDALFHLSKPGLCPQCNRLGKFQKSDAISARHIIRANNTNQPLHDDRYYALLYENAQCPYYICYSRSPFAAKYRCLDCGSRFNINREYAHAVESVFDLIYVRFLNDVYIYNRGYRYYKNMMNEINMLVTMFGDQFSIVDYDLKCCPWCNGRMCETEGENLLTPKLLPNRKDVEHMQKERDKHVRKDIVFKRFAPDYGK